MRRAALHVYRAAHTLWSQLLVRSSLPLSSRACNASYTQDGKLPLHHAASKGAPHDVMKLLLDANPEAVTTADGVRR